MSSPQLKAIAARELAVVDDGDGCLHYLAMLVPLLPNEVRQRERAEPAVVSWQIGRRLWAAHQRSLSPSAAYPASPPYLHLRGVIPPDLLGLVDAYPWPADLPAYSRNMTFGDWANLPSQQALLAFENDVIAQHPFGFDVEAEQFFEHRLVRRVAPGAAAVPHRDHDIDPQRRWVGLVCYFTPTDQYEGGHLVMTATGEHLRPERGDAMLIRGDVEHEVSRVTSGHRVSIVAFKSEPRPDHAPLTEIDLGVLGEPDNIG